MILLGQILAYQAASDPRRPAISYGSEIVTRQDLKVCASRRARSPQSWRRYRRYDHCRFAERARVLRNDICALEVGRDREHRLRPNCRIRSWAQSFNWPIPNLSPVSAHRASPAARFSPAVRNSTRQFRPIRFRRRSRAELESNDQRWIDRTSQDHRRSHARLAHMERKLARYKGPRSMEFVASTLRDDAGKVRRSALRGERVPKA